MGHRADEALIRKPSLRARSTSIATSCSSLAGTATAAGSLPGICSMVVSLIWRLLDHRIRRSLNTPPARRSSRPNGSPNAVGSPASAPNSLPTPSSTAASSARYYPPAAATGWACSLWSPLAGGMLTGQYRKDQQSNTHRNTYGFAHMSNERRLDAVEALVPLADQAGLSLAHMAMAFVLTHPDVTSALVGPRTMDHLDDLLAGAEVVLGDDLLDAIVPPGDRRQSPGYGLPTARHHHALAAPTPTYPARCRDDLIHPGPRPTPERCVRAPVTTARSRAPLLSHPGRPIPVTATAPSTAATKTASAR